VRPARPVSAVERYRDELPVRARGLPRTAFAGRGAGAALAALRVARAAGCAETWLRGAADVVRARPTAVRVATADGARRAPL
jgi:hypothetical protein